MAWMSALYNRTGETMKIQTEVRRIDVLRAIVAVHIGTRQNYIAFLMIAAVILWLNLYNDDFDNSFSWWFSYSILSLCFTLIGFLFSMLITIPFVLFRRLTIGVLSVGMNMKYARMVFWKKQI